ncbi:hexose transporter [Coprinopsis cinerea okayama7|uniref:Hexose transporter n=1 Tax=Coprinopsis cinerea (strain Okayama-7 / 130 / ATCC MYA-4618 / FGSC 9003) TaxID=240176 RepID=A8NUE5_COPC7|nr:hexose transporter [Coprinopsis cinerea okayama7\|eukprot:XP_001836437.1 hexose transporter [Coprinopsis cinerea okayama7\
MASRDLPELSIADLIDNGNWWRNRGLLFLNIALIIPLLTSVVNGLDSSLVNGLQILPAWTEYFNDPKGVLLGIVGSSQFLGNLFGLPLSPFISDWFGRRAALFGGSIIMLAGVAIQATSTSIGMFIASRVIIGFGLSFCTNAAPLLLIELAYPTHRGKVTALYNSCWYFGSILSAWVCFGAFEHAEESQWSWRIPSIMQALFPVVQVLAMWFIPESPRWLVSKGRESRAAQILAKYHANGGDERDPLVVFEMAQIRHALRLEEKINKTTSYLSLFQTPGNRRRMRLILGIGVFSQWSSQVFNFFIALGAAMLIDWCGRRTLFIISNAGMLVAFGAWTITVALFTEKDLVNAAKATIPLIFLYYFFYDLAYTPLLVSYSLEILPFRIRAKGFAFMNITIMATIAFNLFINPIALNAIGWWYYLVYCGWLIIELAFVLAFIVETRGRTLEETAAMFDGDEQSYDLIMTAGTAAKTSERSRIRRDFEQPMPFRRKHSYRPSTGESAQIFELDSKRRSDSTGSMTRNEKDRPFVAL